MKSVALLAVPLLAFAAPAHATNYAASFTGTVAQTQGSTGEAVGNTVSGSFLFNDKTGDISKFTIAGQSAPGGASSTATIVPALTDAIYQVQISPVATGGSTNVTFSLDLSSLTTWPSTDTAGSLLVDTAQLTSNLDTVTNPLSAFPSTFGYFMADASGNNVTSLTADLTSINASTSAVPEPASLSLLALAAFGLVAVRRRHSTHA